MARILSPLTGDQPVVITAGGSVAVSVYYGAGTTTIRCCVDTDCDAGLPTSSASRIHNAAVAITKPARTAPYTNLPVSIFSNGGGVADDTQSMTLQVNAAVVA